MNYVEKILKKYRWRKGNLILQFPILLLKLLPKVQMLVTLLIVQYLKNCMGYDFNYFNKQQLHAIADF